MIDDLCGIDCSDIVERDRFREQFWALYKSMKEKTTAADEIAAKKELYQFCNDELKDLSDDELEDTFGEKWWKFVKGWIKNAVLFYNKN